MRFVPQGSLLCLPTPSLQRSHCIYASNCLGNNGRVAQVNSCVINKPGFSVCAKYLSCNFSGLAVKLLMTLQLATKLLFDNSATNSSLSIGVPAALMGCEIPRAATPADSKAFGEYTSHLSKLAVRPMPVPGCQISGNATIPLAGDPCRYPLFA